MKRDIEAMALRAYPRSRGGTVSGHFDLCALGGLSPLTRGNRVVAVVAVATLGPIPAHAGEPATAGTSQRQRRAYPRSRGGTSAIVNFPNRARGLSPLTRGNHQPRFSVWPRLGPIPAHAGEPPS